VKLAWARERTERPESLLALLVDLKCFQRMARFCSREEIPHAASACPRKSSLITGRRGR